MRTPLIPLALSLIVLLAAPLAGAAEDWRVADIKDVPLPVKQALIAESEKQAGDNEVTHFTYFQTGLEAKETRFKAEFRTPGKQWTVIAKPDGTIESSTAAGDKADHAGEPSGHAKPNPGPKAPEP